MIINKAHDHVDQMLSRATLSGQDLKMFSASVLAGGPEAQNSEKGKDWVVDFRRRVPIRKSNLDFSPYSVDEVLPSDMPPYPDFSIHCLLDLCAILEACVDVCGHGACECVDA